MIATGGTGGHIYPALALAEILKKEYPECEIVFFGSDDRMEKDLIPEKGYRFIGMHMKGMNGGLKAKINSAVTLLKARNECIQLLKKEQPDACIGFGNYISVPLIMAAKSLHIPTMLHEQNSAAGKANKMLSHYADAIAVSSNAALKEFPENKTRVCGNPESTIASVKTFDRNELATYGLDPEKDFIVFMMGSLGSSSVAEKIDEALPLLDKNVQVLVVVGKSNDYTFKQNNTENVHIVPYVDGLLVLSFTKLAILRAGATTLSEITTLGTPSILIPSPYVPNNHQVHNAMELVENDAAIMIEEKDLTKETLSNTVNKLLQDDEKLNTLKSNLKNMAHNDAAYQMIDWLKELK